MATNRREAPLYETIADIGGGLIIAKVKLSDIKEQDKNARIMNNDMQTQLTDNIKKRGQLESLPFCALVDGKIEIISGHHRVRSANASGIFEEIYVLLDITGLTRSQIAAKQIAHNAISGFDDKDTLKEIAKLIQEVDDMLESYLGKEILEAADAVLDKLIAPSVEFEWKNITFTFLPHQVNDLDKLVEVIKTQGAEYVGVAPIEEYERFAAALRGLQKTVNIKNIGGAVHFMAQTAMDNIEGIDYDDTQSYTLLARVLNTVVVPSEAGSSIKKALNKMVENGEIEANAKWRALEMWALNYLEG